MSIDSRMSRRYAVLWLLPALLLFAYPAQPEQGFWHDEGSGDGFWYVESYDDGSQYLWLLDKDLNPIEGWEMGNPSPDEGDGSGAPTPEEIKDYIERHHKTRLSKGEQLNNPLNLKRSAAGEGRDPIWIPSESATDVEGGPSGGPGADSGDVAGWVKGQARRGSDGDDEDSDDSSIGERPELGSTGSVKPEIINPPPFLSEPMAEPTVEGL